jgi:nucleoside-diphosphate-sugar epimerase
MRIFLAGATGVLGRATVPRLVAAGHEVRGVARSPEKAEQLRAQGAEAVTVDLFDADGVRDAVAGCDAVVHMATSIPVLTKGARLKGWAMNDRLRREGTRTLVDAALANGVTRFVKESVCFFYPDSGDAWIDEDTPVMPWPMAAATLDAEASAVGFTGEGRTGVALRFGLFYGPDARATEEGLAMARRGFGPMIGRNESYQPSIHHDDAATAIIAALDAPSGHFNVCDDPITKGEWNAAFADAFGIDKTLRPTPKLVVKAGGTKMDVVASSRRVSAARFREATRWLPVYPDARIGLKATAAAWRERTDG